MQIILTQYQYLMLLSKRKSNAIYGVENSENKLQCFIQGLQNRVMCAALVMGVEMPFTVSVCFYINHKYQDNISLSLIHRASV